MYHVLLDDKEMLISGSPEYKLINPKLTMAVNSVGTFTFGIAVNHPLYDSIVVRKSIITVKADNDILFKGRIFSRPRGFLNTVTYKVEGLLGYLNDSIVRPYSFSGNLLEYFTFLIDQHNEQVNEFQKFKVGRVTVIDNSGNPQIVRRSSIAPKTWEEINNKLIDDYGGYLIIRYEQDGMYLDYLADYEDVNGQSIEFGRNLIDLETDFSTENLVTCVFPIGAEDEETGERLTIASVNNGLDYIYDEELVSKYGKIFETVEFNEVTKAGNLLTKAQEYLANKVLIQSKLTVKAIDLHLMSPDIERIRLGYINTISEPHGIANERLLLTTLEIPLTDPKNATFTLAGEKTYFTRQQIKRQNQLGYQSQQMQDALDKAASSAKLISITADTYVFKRDSAGNMIGATVANVTADCQNCRLAKWEYMNASGVWVTYPGSGTESILTVEAMDGTFFNDTCKIKATADSGIYDTLTITKISDGNGTGGLAVIVANENQTIACTSGGIVAEATMIEIPFLAFVGTEQTACSVIVGNLPYGVTVQQNKASSATEQGVIILMVASGGNLGGTMNGSIPLDFTLQGKTLRKTFTWSKSMAGTPGKSASVITITADTYVFKTDASGNMIGKTDAYVSAVCQNCSLSKWEYLNTLGVWTEYPGAFSDHLSVAATDGTFVNDTCKIKATADTGVSDTLTITKISDGNGTGGLAVIVANENQTIACNSDGTVAEATTIQIPFLAFVGTEQTECTAVVGTLPSGMTLTGNTASSAEREGTITITVSANSTLGNKKNGTILLDFTLQGKMVRKTFTWSKSMAGANGAAGPAGRSIVQVTNYYLATSAAEGVTTETAGWTPAVQQTNADKRYLWNYEIIDYSDNTSDTIEPHLIGTHGENGAPGKGIKTITEYYLATSAAEGVTTETAGWTTAMQYVSLANKYLWNYEVTTYTDDSNTHTEPAIIGVYGDSGKDGTAEQYNLIPGTQYLKAEEYIKCSGSYVRTENTENFAEIKLIQSSNEASLTLVSTLDATEKAYSGQRATFSCDFFCSNMSQIKGKIAIGYTLMRNTLEKPDDFTTQVNYSTYRMDAGAMFNSGDFVDGNWFRLEMHRDIATFSNNSIDTRFKYRYGIIIRLVTDSPSGSEIKIRKPKLELGNVASAWMPHTLDPADKAADIVDKMWDQRKIIDRLTNNGEAEGIYFDPDTGQLYINATFIMLGILSSLNGETVIDLETGQLSFANGKMTFTTNGGLKIVGTITAEGKISITDGTNTTDIAYEIGDYTYVTDTEWDKDCNLNNHTTTSKNTQWLRIDAKLLRVDLITVEQLNATNVYASEQIYGYRGKFPYLKSHSAETQNAIVNALTIRPIVHQLANGGQAVTIKPILILDHTGRECAKVTYQPGSGNGDAYDADHLSLYLHDEVIFQNLVSPEKKEMHFGKQKYFYKGHAIDALTANTDYCTVTYKLKHIEFLNIVVLSAVFNVTTQIPANTTTTLGTLKDDADNPYCPASNIPCSIWVDATAVLPNCGCHITSSNRQIRFFSTNAVVVGKKIEISAVWIC